MTAAERQAARGWRSDLFVDVMSGGEVSEARGRRMLGDLASALDSLDEKDRRIAELEALVGEDKLNLFSRLKNEQTKATNRETAGCRSCREEITKLEADKARLDWLDVNPNRVTFAQGYVGAKSTWSYKDGNTFGNDAANLREAIDAAIKAHL